MDAEQFELTVSLRKHFEERMEALEKINEIRIQAVEKQLTDALAAYEKMLEARRGYVEVRLSSSEKAVAVARAEMEKRLEAMNEFRNALKDQNATFITRAEHESGYAKLDEDIHKLELSEAAVKGKASQMSAITGIALAGAALLVSLGGLILQISKNTTP